MKKCVLFVILIVSLTAAKAQSDEAQQLLLNVEKLTQFKQILKQMKDAYEILHKGYTAIRDISQGSFNIHKTFLDALFEVSPSVRKYKRIADIIDCQILLVKNYKASYNEFKSNGQFTEDEVEYIGKVYSGLVSASMENLDELGMVITAGKLRMSDDERLQAIDRIYASIGDQLSFLQEFNNQTAILSMQRKSDQAEIELSKRIGGY